VNRSREPAALQEWLNSLSKIKRNWPTRGWSFDNRFGCLASTFRSDVAPQARSAVAQILPTEWSESSLRLAPSVVREVAARTGGVRAGQFLFSNPLGGPIVAYGLWWPWEEGSTISMRVGVEGAGDLSYRLCEAMGVDP
jgi:hypothetical protein